MPYFDSSQDTALVYATVRTDDELENVAARAEADVIDRFTAKNDEDDFEVFLDGYDEDPTLADGYDDDRSAWTGLAAALRQTIANVISHRLRYYDVDATASLVVRGSRTVARAAGTLDPEWPKGWQRRLQKFDTRPKVFIL